MCRHSSFCEAIPSANAPCHALILLGHPTTRNLVRAPNQVQNFAENKNQSEPTVIAVTKTRSIEDIDEKSLFLFMALSNVILGSLGINLAIRSTSP